MVGQGGLAGRDHDAFAEVKPVAEETSTVNTVSAPSPEIDAPKITPGVPVKQGAPGVACARQEL